MDDKTNTTLKRLAVSSLENCLAKLSRVSAGTWNITSADVRPGTLGDALKMHPFKSREAAAVWFSVACDHPFTAIMLFETDDMECVSKCFLGYAFPGVPGIKLPEEVMLVELGNIVLNSVVSVVSNGLKKVLMPAVPRYAIGDAPGLAAEFAAALDPKRDFRIITLALGIRSGGDVSGSTVLCLMPEKLAGELTGLHG